MTDLLKKELHPEYEDTKLLFDVFIQLMALQKLLIKKNIFTLDELQSAINEETALLLKPFLEKMNVPQDKIVEVLEASIKNRDGIK